MLSKFCAGLGVVHLRRDCAGPEAVPTNGLGERALLGNVLSKRVLIAEADEGEDNVLLIRV